MKKIEQEKAQEEKLNNTRRKNSVVYAVKEFDDVLIREPVIYPKKRQELHTNAADHSTNSILIHDNSVVSTLDDILFTDTDDKDGKNDIHDIDSKDDKEDKDNEDDEHGFTSPNATRKNKVTVARLKFGAILIKNISEIILHALFCVFPLTKGNSFNLVKYAPNIKYYKKSGGQMKDYLPKMSHEEIDRLFVKHIKKALHVKDVNLSLNFMYLRSTKLQQPHVDFDWDSLDKYGDDLYVVFFL